MRAKIKINGREITVEDIKKVSAVGKFTGLMFRKHSPALLFKFSKGRKAIHSLFCYPFVAIWILEGKVVEYKIVDSWKFSITPEKDFDTLLEVPLNEKYIHLLDFFVDKNEKAD